MSHPKTYRFPFIRPVVPPAVSKWAHYLEPAYRAKWFSNFGPVLHQFETELSKRLCHADEVITTTNNCTSGIAAALIAQNVFGTVLIPAFTFPATASAVIMARAEPCVLDVDRDTWCLSASLTHASFLRSRKLRTMNNDPGHAWAGSKLLQQFVDAPRQQGVRIA
jgi:dTDP-4-amino-4,6-dideoxygalactose transaminase